MSNPYGNSASDHRPGDALLFDRRAEQYVLGECLRGDDEELIDRVLGRPGVDGFEIDEHQIILQAIEKIRSDNGRVSAFAVEAEIRRRGLGSRFGADPNAILEYLNACAFESGLGTDIEIRISAVVEMAERRRLNNIVAKLRQDIRDPSCPPSAASAEAEQALAGLSDSANEDDGVWSHEIADEIFDEIEQGPDSPHRCGIPTGLVQLDEIIGGFPPGELILVAGRTSMGKSALALGFARNIMHASGRPVLYVSMEMDRKSIMRRLAAMESGVSISTIVGKELPTDEDMEKVRAARQRIKEGPRLLIQDNRNITINQIVALARRAKLRHNIAAVFVDYIQLIEGAEAKREQNREGNLAAISRRLQALPQMLNVPVVALAQVNRNAEGPSRQKNGYRPRLSDIRESGSLEQDADKVLFVYRSEVYDCQESDWNHESAGRAEIIVAKNRNGEIDTAHVYYHGPTVHFHDGRPIWKELVPSVEERPRYTQAKLSPSANGHVDHDGHEGAF